MGSWMGGWICGWMGGFMGGWMGRWMGGFDGWVDGWMWLEGKQQTLQPPLSKSDQRFRDQTTVYAATVAHNRSGNERAMNMCKRSRMMKCGFYLGMNPNRFNYVCSVWAFGANFMCKPVL